MLVERLVYPKLNQQTMKVGDVIEFISPRGAQYLLITCLHHGKIHNGYPRVLDYFDLTNNTLGHFNEGDMGLCLHIIPAKVVLG